MPPTRRLLDEVRKAIRHRHYSYRTEKTYVHWIWRFVVFHGKQHPKLLGAEEVEKYLSHLAQDRNVTASTQSQALAALLFLYKRVLNVNLPWIDNVVRATRPKRLPTVLGQQEVQSVLHDQRDQLGKEPVRHFLAEAAQRQTGLSNVRFGFVTAASKRTRRPS